MAKGTLQIYLRILRREDSLGGHIGPFEDGSRRRGDRSSSHRQRLEGAELPALKMKEGPQAKGAGLSPEAGKVKGVESSPEPPAERSPADTDFSPMGPTSKL